MLYRKLAQADINLNTVLGLSGSHKLAFQWPLACVV